jgi:hypothetical protein
MKKENRERKNERKTEKRKVRKEGGEKETLE